MGQCTQLSAINFDNRQIHEGSGGIDAPSEYYEVLRNEVVSSGQHRVLLRLHFANLGRGRSMSVWVDGMAPGAEDATTFGFTLVEVETVNAPIETSISEAELRNGILIGISRKFANGHSGRLKDPSYKPTVKINSGLVHFVWDVGVTTPSYFCDGRAKVKADFTIVPSGTSVRVVHLSRDVSSTFGYCNVLRYIPGVNAVFAGIVGYFEEQGIEDLKDRIDKTVAAQFAMCQNVGGINCEILKLDVRIEPGQIRVIFNDPLLNRVSIRAPYDSENLGLKSPLANGIAMLPEDKILVMASGLVNACETGYRNVYGFCPTVSTGPGGLYDADVNFPGVGDNFLHPESGFLMQPEPFFHGASKYWRQNEGLPMTEENIGALIARTADSQSTTAPVLANGPCRLQIGTDTTNRVAFGINDTHRAINATYGSGMYRVHFLWVPVERIFTSFLPCRPARHTVQGAIRSVWLLNHAEIGFLGWPNTNEENAADGGRFSEFEHGVIYWTPATKAHEVHGAILAKWTEMGRERSWLGYPTTNEQEGARGGRFNHFMRGSIYWHPSPAIGTHVVWGAIHDLWTSLGSERSPLGYPVNDEEEAANGGRRNHFENGWIYWSPSPTIGAHAVIGPILQQWVAQGAEAGSFGYPTGEQFKSSGNRISQKFEMGTITVPSS